MIRIDRGLEPPELVDVQKQELERVRTIGKPTSDDIGSKYRTFATHIREAQKSKCCYCEVHVQTRYNDVEHFRPKARADRRPGSPARHGYWWLAWTWSNLLFACPGCNRSGKNDRFPLDRESVALVPEEEPPGRERPLLIDPAEENGICSIQFVPVELSGGTLQWLPEPRNGSQRGRYTIDVLGLGRDELLDLYSYHAQRVELIIKDIECAMQSLDGEKVEREWHRAMRELEPYNEFVALTHDMLVQAFPAEVREHWDLTFQSQVSDYVLV